MMILASPLRFFRLWRAIGIALVAGAIVVSLIPLPYTFSMSYTDKIWHALTYACLMFWFVQLFRWKRNWLLALGFMAMGVLIEGLQYLTGYRTAELADVLANTSGVLAGWALFRTPLGGSLQWFDTRLARIRQLSNS